MTPTGRSWLSRQAPELVARLRDTTGHALDCDLLIVGSGYGGAVAAARAAGHQVKQPDGGLRPARIWVLERGSEYQPGMFPSRWSELAGHVRLDTQNGRPALGRPEGLFDARIGSDVGALLGNGLGGGSLINAGVMEKPADDVFAADWPTSLTRAQLDDGYDKVHAMLQPRPVPAERECTKLHVLDGLLAPYAKAERCDVTVHWRDERNAAGVDMRACTLCGDCLTGCNQGAKGSLDTNYLAFARARGVEMFCGGTVRTVERGGDCWQVRWSYTERTLRSSDDQTFIVRAGRVVLAAGALGTTEILLRSKAAGLPLSDQVGCRFSANGDKITAGAKHPRRVGAVGDQETDPADPDARRVGPTITGLVRVPAAEDEGAAFALEEFAVPAGLRNVYGEVVALLAALGEDRIGDADPYAATDEDIEHIALYGSMGDDGAAGTIELPEPPSGGGRTEGVKIQWPDLRTHRLFQRVGRWLQPRQQPAITVPNPTAPALGGFLLTALPPVTVHPLGGCRMADGPGAGVVDDCGRVFDPKGGTHANLFVLDGSIVPRALGINPAFTIAALAERAMPLLLREWGWHAAQGAKPLAPRPRGRRRELPARDVVWSIRERVQGLCSFDGSRPLWARLEIEFEEIPGFRRALALTSRAVAVRRADLALYAARAGDDEFTVDEPDGRQPLCRATLAGSVELFAPIPGAPPGDERTRLVYRLSVQSVQGDGAVPLAVGGRLEGVKVLGREPGVRDVSPWRQLSEMQMRYDGRAVGRWALDLADLAQRRDPLLRAVRLSSMPDVLDDAGAVVFYVLRRLLSRLLAYYDQFGHLQPSMEGLAERWPVAPAGHVAIRLPDGARLTRYPPSGASTQGLPPVVLIHGLGSTGASFVDAALPEGAVSALRNAGRDVWVLDVRSSTGNEFARHPPVFEYAKRWTVDGVARDDLPAAIDEVLQRTQQRQVDVFAHCMGAVMFCLAALGSERLEGKVRAAVLSQVGPLIRFSPMNRLRGYVASYLQQFLRIDTVDTAPDFVSCIEHGEVRWEKRPADDIAGRLMQVLVDLALFTFPYPNDDDEAGRQQSEPLLESDFRVVRHRGDAIFGQLFELANVSDAVLLRLQAFLGWVMVPMLAQAIHFARRNMLTDKSGRNTVLHHANFARRFAFPLLIVHGRRNRVFDWRGSLASWRLLTQLRRDNDAAPPESLPGGGGLYGKGTRTQLAVLDRYGHLDCLIGTDAHAHVFPLVTAFLNDAHRLPNRGPNDVTPQFEAPWIGPMLGWLTLETGAGGASWWRTRVLIHAAPRRVGTLHVVVMPMTERAGVLVPDTEHARVLPWRPARPGAHHSLLDLRITAVALRAEFQRFAVLTVHDDIPFEPGADTRRIIWSPDGVWIGGPIETALVHWCADPRNATALADSVFTLAPKLQVAADADQPKAPTERVSFALASCQYPQGLFDAMPAGAGYERLRADAVAPDGPQFLVLCGDQVYLDETAGAFDPIAAASGTSDVQDAPIDRSYELNFRLPPMRATVARLPVVAMFDDHEIENDWKGLDGEADPPREAVERALDAYQRHQGLLNPARPLVRDPAAGYGFVSHPGGVPLIVLDTRSRRSLRDATSIDRARIIPDAAMRALCQQLADPAASALVKLIVSPSPILPPERYDAAHPAERLRSDTWSGYPASTVELLSFIRERDIRRVVFLSGDAHLCSVSSLAFDGASGPNQVVSVVSSGLYTPWPFVNQRPDELVLDGAVDLGWPGRPFVGSMTLHAMSAHAGHAVVAVEHDRDGRMWLDVSLRAAQGATTDCRVALR